MNHKLSSNSNFSNDYYCAGNTNAYNSVFPLSQCIANFELRTSLFLLQMSMSLLYSLYVIYFVYYYVELQYLTRDIINMHLHLYRIDTL